MGGANKTAGELIRLLVNHPDVTLKWVESDIYAGQSVSSVHQGLLGESDITFCNGIDLDGIDVLFMCNRYGSSRAFVEQTTLPPDLRVIDLSPDFRMAGDHDFVYGLPELNRRNIVHDCRHVACPGGYATAILLAILPLARNLMLNSDMHVCAIKGSTGTGSTDNNNWDYSWQNNNMTVYKPFAHEQLGEIREVLSSVQMSFNSGINFVPMRGAFPRGVLAAIYLDSTIDIEVLRKLYDEYYDDHNFTFVTDRRPDLKDVVNTNKCLIHLERIDGKLIITSVIDNMLKGASGTAVHNMNLLFGLHERVGLMLKASAF